MADSDLLFIRRQTLDAIGDAIREKLGTTDKYSPDDMPGAIRSIEGGGIIPAGELDITADGVYDVTAYASVDVHIEHQPVEYDATTDEIEKLYAGDSIVCPYSGEIVSVDLPAGVYRLECWGADGGDGSATAIGAAGGYINGEYMLIRETPVYLVTGGKGKTTTSVAVTQSGTGGYNGGGNAGNVSTGSIRVDSGGGGGATHISFADGLLADQDGSPNSVLLAAGGGAGNCELNTEQAGGSAGDPAGGGDELPENSPSYGEKIVPGGATGVAPGTAGRLYKDMPIISDVEIDGNPGAFGTGGDGKYCGGGGAGWYGGAGGVGNRYTDLTISANYRGLSMTGGGGSNHRKSNVMPFEAESEENPDTSGNGYIRISVVSISQ